MLHPRSVPDITSVAAPLHRLTRKWERFLFNEACQEALDGLKSKSVETVLPQAKDRKEHTCPKPCV